MSQEPAATPPAGMTSNFENPSGGLNLWMRVAQFLCIPIVTLFVFLRMFVKIFMQRKFYVEDCTLPLKVIGAFCHADRIRDVLNIVGKSKIETKRLRRKNTDLSRDDGHCMVFPNDHKYVLTSHPCKSAQSHRVVWQVLGPVEDTISGTFPRKIWFCISRRALDFSSLSSGCPKANISSTRLTTPKWSSTDH
jgi:hypothetical protein